MSRTLDEVNRELMRIREMPYGLARTQAAERQVRLVEAEGPDAARAFALSVLVDSMYWAGEVEKSYLPFTLLVRWWDEHPELFDEIDRHSLFWYFKWMVNDLADYPTVPVAQIEATLDDMERRYALAGHGRDAVAYSRFCWAAARGAEDVERLFQEWVATPRDEFSQCEVCDPGDRASHLRATGRLEETVRLIEQTLAEGATCATEPADMLSHLALAYLDLGRPQDAARAHRRAVATLAESKGEMEGARGRRIVLLGRGGQPERAVRAIEEDARLLLAAETPAARLGLLVDVVEGTAAMLPDHGDLPVRAAGVPAGTVGELHAWAVGEAEPLAAAFDRRNGTTRESDLLAAARAARPAPTPLDLDLGLLDPTRAPAGAATGAGVTGGSAADDVAVDHTAAAEQALAAGRTEEAAQAYARAAAAAQDAGRVVDAGYAWAEAARCAQVLADDATAHVLYARAVALLRAGDVEPQDVAPVVVAWAPAAASSGHADTLVEVADTLVEALAGAPGDGEVAPEGAALAQRREAERRRAAADLDDAAARVLASVADAAGSGGPGPEGAPGDGVPGDAPADGGTPVDRAVARAARAAEAYASVGALGDAAHAFWLAGRLLDGQGRTQDAVWHLESAVEGFGLAHDRQTRARAADDLVALLRRTGQDARAEEVLSTLSR